MLHRSNVKVEKERESEREISFFREIIIFSGGGGG